MREGAKVYFVPSLWEHAIPCTVSETINYDPGRKDGLYIIARTAAGQVIEGYAAQFTRTRPRARYH